MIFTSSPIKSQISLKIEWKDENLILISLKITYKT